MTIEFRAAAGASGDDHALTTPAAAKALTCEPLAKLLGSRLGSVLQFSGVNHPIVLDFDCVFWS